MVVREKVRDGDEPQGLGWGCLTLDFDGTRGGTRKERIRVRRI